MTALCPQAHARPRRLEVSNRIPASADRAGPRLALDKALMVELDIVETEAKGARAAVWAHPLKIDHDFARVSGS